MDVRFLRRCCPTVRYLSLLAILLHPTPPPLIALEEPELGLHPDVVAEVAKLVVQSEEAEPAQP